MQKVYYGLNWGLGAVFPSESYGSIQTSASNYITKAGGLINFKVSDNFSFRHELNLGIEIVNASKKNARPLLIEIPWLLNFHFNDQNFMFGGMQNNLLLVKPNSSSENESLIRSDIDMAFAVGFGHIWEDNWHVNLRFVQSINQLGRIQNQDFNSIQVNLAYLFHKLSDQDQKLMRVRKKRLKKPVLDN